MGLNPVKISFKPAIGYLCLALAFLIVSIPLCAQPLVKGMSLGAPYTHLRSGPGLDHDIVTQVPYGSFLNYDMTDEQVDTLKQIRGNWVQTEYLGKTGWLFDQYLMPVPNEIYRHDSAGQFYYKDFRLHPQRFWEEHIYVLRQKSEYLGVIEEVSPRFKWVLPKVGPPGTEDEMEPEDPYLVPVFKNRKGIRMLIISLEPLPTGSVNSIKLTPKRLSPNALVSYGIEKGPSITFQIGGRRNEKISLERKTRIWDDYLLKVSSTGVGEVKRQQLTGHLPNEDAPRKEEERLPSVVWRGDLNNDRVVDLILLVPNTRDVCDAYEKHCLLLSSDEPGIVYRLISER